MLKYREKNKDKMSDTVARWRKDNKPKVQAYTKEYYSSLPPDKKMNRSRVRAKLYLKHKDKIRSKQKERYMSKRNDIESKKRGWFSVYNSQAKRRGIEMTLSKEEFESLVFDKHCYYCGSLNQLLGLDRKNNDIGYHIHNVVPCCSSCNFSKHTKTHEQFVSMCRTIAKRFEDME